MNLTSFAKRELRNLQGLEPKAFKDAMRNAAGGVSVVTAGIGNDRTGATVTSATALSIEPATMIVNINRHSSTYAVLRRFGHFCVNILSSDQQDIAMRFAGLDGVKGTMRYQGAEWITRASGAPVLLHALAAIDCEVEEIIDRHSHGIVLGRVVSVEFGSGPALVYQSGRYRSFVQETT